MPTTLSLGMFPLEAPSVSISFPYRYKSSPFGKIPDLTITVPVSTWYGWKPFDFMVDSGADISLVPKMMADLVGADLSKLPCYRSYGIEGKGVPTYHGPLKLKFGKDSVKVPCLFSSQEDSPILLGRAGLFDHYTIIFDNHSKEIIFRSI